MICRLLFPLFLFLLYPPHFFVARLPTLVLCATYTMIWKEKHKMGSLLRLLHFRDRWSFTDEKCAVSRNSRKNKKKRDQGIKTLAWPLNKIVRSAMTAASVYSDGVECAGDKKTRRAMVLIPLEFCFLHRRGCVGFSNMTQFISSFTTFPWCWLCSLIHNSELLNQ